jgi:hypothetical protein
MTRRFWSGVLAMGAVAGCDSYALRKPTIVPVHAFGAVPAHHAQVCVVRPHWMAWTVTAVVRDNDVLVGATRGPTYFCYRIRPGRHRITSRADTTEAAVLVAAPGRRYYLHQNVDNLFGVVRTRLAWVDETRAHSLVVRCGYRELAEVPGSERLPDATPVAARE